MDDGPHRLSFLGRPIPARFELRAVALAPGRELPYDEAQWEDALVLVERGQIELECHAGGRRRFRRGDVLSLAGLRLRAVRNPCREPALIVAIRRRARTDDFMAAAPSEGT